LPARPLAVPFDTAMYAPTPVVGRGTQMNPARALGRFQRDRLTLDLVLVVRQMPVQSHVFVPGPQHVVDDQPVFIVYAPR